MRVCFLNDGRVRDVPPCEAEGIDVYLCGFADSEPVCYERELKGETRFFEETALFSKRCAAPVFRGCITDTRGYLRKSVAVAENGRLKGVADMLNAVDGAWSSGAALRLFETGIGRAGVIVSEDLAYPNLLQSLSLCGAEFIVCLFQGVSANAQRALLCANAYCFGVPILFCANGYSAVANVEGEIEFATPQNGAVYEVRKTSEYHLVQTRRRGAYTSKGDVF